MGVRFTPSAGHLEVYLPATEIGPELTKKKIHELSDREECQEFQLLVAHLIRSQFVEKDECDRFPYDSEKKRTASWFEDRLDSRASRFLRLLVSFVVTVDHEELVFFIVESFSHVRRAFFCILVLLKKNQVSDLVVVEHRFDST